MSNTILHQITSGVTGWLAFHQMKDSVSNFDESSIYFPIQDIAKSRSFEVRREFPIPKTKPGRGSYKEIDFVLVDRRSKIIYAIEIKYKKKDKSMAGTLSDDVRKLSGLTTVDIDAQIIKKLGLPIRKSVAGFRLIKAVLVVWRSSDFIVHLRNKEVPHIKKQIFGLIAGAHPKRKHATSKELTALFLDKVTMRAVGNRFGSLRVGSTLTPAFRFWVCCIFETPTW